MTNNERLDPIFAGLTKQAAYVHGLITGACVAGGGVLLGFILMRAT